jgi:hypothetical protein
VPKLNDLHAQHLKSFDRPMEEEHKIEIMTSEITALFHRCQKVIGAIGKKVFSRKGKEKKRKTRKGIRKIAFSFFFFFFSFFFFLLLRVDARFALMPCRASQTRRRTRPSRAT